MFQKNVISNADASPEIPTLYNTYNTPLCYKILLAIFVVPVVPIM